MRRTAFIYSLMALMVVGLASVVVAQSLPRLPKDFRFPQGDGSPGVVTFSHEMHLAVQEKPDCTTCHPKHFKILEPGAPVGATSIRHELMQKKQQCGVCHNGEAASGLDGCDYCHK